MSILPSSSPTICFPYSSSDRVSSFCIPYDNSPLSFEEEALRAKIFCKRRNDQETFDHYTCEQQRYARYMIKIVKYFSSELSKDLGAIPTDFNNFYTSIATWQNKLAQELRFYCAESFGKKRDVLTGHPLTTPMLPPQYDLMLDMLTERLKEKVSDEKEEIRVSLPAKDHFLIIFCYQGHIINMVRHVPGECSEIEHCPPQYFPLILNSCSELFPKLLQMPLQTSCQEKEFFLLLGRFHWLLSNGCIFNRGSGSITEIAIASILHFRGLLDKLGSWKNSADLLALTRPISIFSAEYQTYRL